MNDTIEKAAREIAELFASAKDGGVVRTFENGVTAILRKHFGPSEPRIRGHGRLYISRAVLGGYQYLKPDGTWTSNCMEAYYDSQDAAEAALAKTQEQPQ